MDLLADRGGRRHRRHGTGVGPEDRGPGLTAAALDVTLAALADPQRRRIVDLLRQRPHRSGEIADLLKLNAPLVSRHLKVLRDSDLVEDHHPAFDTRVRVYRLKAGRWGALKTWAADIEAMWADQLEAFKAHVEGTGETEA